MYLKNGDGICYLSDPIHGNTFKRKNLPEMLSGAEIYCSWDGWLLMSKDMESIFFFNPFTAEQGEYPRREMFCIVGIGFSTLPTSLDCTTIVIFDTHDTTCFSFIHSREMAWRYVYQVNGRDFTAVCNPVFLDTAFYVLGSNGNLGVFNLNIGEGHCDVLAKPERPCNSFSHGYLVECDGELLSVFVGHLGKWVEVFRLNRTDMVWVKIESLGNHMLFVSDSSCVWAVAKTPEMGNKIYFPRFYGETQSIIFYSLETKRYHCFGYEISLENFYGTRKLNNCCWVEPNGF
ncbi:F-box protein At1g49360-like isoform X2 [Malania oleifera]|uniref:F-box protein At1g49360-like isoform X2 n=1 Tax=Malania oleifera TaxID=397392 RepID=UPI0025AEC97A|nr:F-box protein At1g49360-like isoform X2 [Malania oleifera]